MALPSERDDPRLPATRYRIDGTTEHEADTAGQPTMEQREQYIEVLIAQSIRRGDFDDLPGHGKPLPNLGEVRDPDWWIRQKIEREKLTGLGPPALTLRTENARMDDRLDRAGSERAVREIIDDFNLRIIHARRQLLGGPPVVTPTRDVDTEITRWRVRLTERERTAEESRITAAAARSDMTRRERRRADRTR